MNPSNPTATEMRQIEQLFFNQMKRQTKYTNQPGLREREASLARLLSSFDVQFSDQWITT
jgi:hypothetical protein